MFSTWTLPLHIVTLFFWPNPILTDWRHVPQGALSRRRSSRTSSQLYKVRLLKRPSAGVWWIVSWLGGGL